MRVDESSVEYLEERRVDEFRGKYRRVESMRVV